MHRKFPRRYLTPKRRALPPLWGRGVPSSLLFERLPGLAVFYGVTCWAMSLI